MILTSKDSRQVEHLRERRTLSWLISLKDVYSVTGSLSITKELTGESDMNGAIYRIALVLPFLLPMISCVSEDCYGRSILLRYAYAIIFLGAVIVSYAVNLRRAIRTKCRADSLYDLLVLHLVKIPLYVLVWIVAMLIFAIATFRLDGIK